MNLDLRVSLTKQHNHQARLDALAQLHSASSCTLGHGPLMTLPWHSPSGTSNYKREYFKFEIHLKLEFQVWLYADVQFLVSLDLRRSLTPAVAMTLRLPWSET